MAIKRDNNRNEPQPDIGAGNGLPEPRDVDVRAFGRAGQRVLLDRTLQAIDGFGLAQFEAAGIDVREIGAERDTANTLLERVVRYDGRRAGRQRHRSAALRLLGHLKAPETDVIAEVAASRDEPVTVRAAAFDAIGMQGERGGERALELVLAFVDDEDDRIAARALWALGRVGTPEHLAGLEDRLQAMEAGVRHDAIIGAIAEIGVRFGVPVSIPERDRRRPKRQRTGTVDA